MYFYSLRVKTGWEPAALQSLLTTGRYDALWARVSSLQKTKTQEVMAVARRNTGKYTEPENTYSGLKTDHIDLSSIVGASGIGIRSDRDVLSGCTIDSSIRPWPSRGQREINTRVVVPIPYSNSREDMMKTMEYARRNIAISIAEQMISAGMIHFDEHHEFGNYDGADQLIVEGTLCIPY